MLIELEGYACGNGWASVARYWATNGDTDCAEAARRFREAHARCVHLRIEDRPGDERWYPPRALLVLLWPTRARVCADRCCDAAPDSVPALMMRADRAGGDPIV